MPHMAWWHLCIGTVLNSCLFSVRLWYYGTRGQRTPGDCWGRSTPWSQPHPFAGLH